MLDELWRAGTLAGTSPREAYFVRCDASTTTEQDIALGVVNVLVGFAPLAAGEFTLLRLQQRAP